ncbi:alpha/beta fold hydrolase [Catenulispora sp. NF23]|uniref:alpha/beta hydrolase family protein n=1 Tax=Catenulispora pinistramenti TaxID=2705254 RepID=UPI001BAB214D|nr:alpha/beta hydrolase [Catenulispora pinistramenti]MBS2537551.1 alpha/beta fold hydrolase [Catenulispora pinistramenti]
MSSEPVVNLAPSTAATRRSLLRVGVLGGTGTVLLGAGGVGAGIAQAASAAQATPAASAGAPALQGLFTQPDLDFDTLFAFGGTGYGSAEFGELVTAVNAINAAGASYQTYYDTFLPLATRLDRQAGAELAAGHRVSARALYLRAASYYDLCLYFIFGTTARASEAGAYAAMQRCWDLFCQLSDSPFEPVRIPYEGSYLPGYLLRSDERARRRPTVILNNGQDAQNVRMWAFGAAAALERGYNVLIFEGPGQGSMLFERQAFLRPDWEKVITPVVDYLRDRPEVDRDRIVLSGSSLGGELVVRAAAFEHRLAAVVADPGFLSLWVSWQALEKEITSVFDHGLSKQEINALWQQKFVPALSETQRFDLVKAAEPYAREALLAGRAGTVFDDLYGLGTTLMRFTVADVAARVSTPTLVTVYDDDELVTPAAGQGAQVYRLLHADKQIVTFTEAEGAQEHCAPMAPRIRNEVVYDWLDGVL